MKNLTNQPPHLKQIESLQELQEYKDRCVPHITVIEERVV